jgi:Cytochrome oxidase complex assembly protein 1
MNAAAPPPLSADAAPALPLARTPGWWQRHWRWAMPLLCVFCLSFFACIMALFMSMLFGAMRSSVVYTTAMQRMRDHPQVVAALGTPIEPGWYLTGNLKTSGTSGKADLQIPISGPKGEGDLYIAAEKADGQWTYSTLTVGVDGRSAPIDLLPESADSDASR